MKFSKTKSYSLLAAMVAVAGTASAHRAHIQAFGPELAHQEYMVAPSTSTSSFSSSSSAGSLFAGSASNPAKTATDFVEQHLTSSDYIVKNAYTSKHNGVTHVYLRQKVDGLEVVNGDINVNVDQDGHVISYGNSFYQGAPPSKRERHLAKRGLNDRVLSIKEWIREETEEFVEQGRQLTFGRWGRPQHVSKGGGCFILPLLHVHVRTSYKSAQQKRGGPWTVTHSEEEGKKSIGWEWTSRMAQGRRRV